MKTSDFSYNLPKELIAQTPLADRSASRMLTLDKRAGEIAHRLFREFPQFLNAGDCLVLNDTRVISARLSGERSNGGAAELLLLERVTQNTWKVLAKPGRRLKNGATVSFGGGLLKARIIGGGEEDGGVKLAEFSHEGVFEQILGELGEMPLPPYITEKLSDKTRYQTVYAAADGSAAAPTAGLHFTPEILSEAEKKGVKIARITLHVGLGTFRPVKTAEIPDHKMHSEYYEITERTARIINETKREGNRIVAVGTTSARALESAASADGEVRPKSERTEIFIYPPYKFKIVDALLTNFHLPESTLIMLVSALAGQENTLAAYNSAVKEKYRFFSFGDAMLIL